MSEVGGAGMTKVKIDWTIEDVNEFVDQVLRACKEYVESKISLGSFASEVLIARGKLMKK